MISLYQFRNNLLALFRIMIATDMHVDVNYKGQAYRISVEDLNTKVKRRVGGRRSAMIVTIDDVESDKCPECGKLQLAGVCMNSQCPKATSPGPR